MCTSERPSLSAALRTASWSFEYFTYLVRKDVRLPAPRAGDIYLPGGMSCKKIDVDFLEKGIPTPRAQGRCTKIISMIKWITTSRLPI
jgi:hypothetical protein